MIKRVLKVCYQGSEQSDTLNRNVEPVAEVSLPVETPSDILWSPIQTRNRRKTLKNYLECNTGELTTLEIENENENENNTEHQTLEFILNNSRAIKKKRLTTNREKFKGIMEAGGNLVLEFSTATFEMVRTGIKNIIDSLKQNSTMTVDHKQKTDKENNIID